MTVIDIATAETRGDDATLPLRDDLAELISGLDACFVQAGTALAVSVETIDKIVAALAGIGTALEDETGTSAVDTLIGVAQRVSDLPKQCKGRGQGLVVVQQSSNRLHSQITKVLATLRALRIYGMNVKIASWGAPEFVESVGIMFTRITGGEENVKAFNSRLSGLCESVAGVEKMDRMLLLECAKVIPLVPERLAKDAEGLRSHQQTVTDVANATKNLALAIQLKVATALGALQIGDITRQRLENVVGGIQLLHAHQAEWDSDPEAAAWASAHILRLFATQLDETAEEFAVQAALLVESLEGIVPDARRLLTLRGDSAAAEGRSFLRQLEQSIAEIESVTNQLGNTDRQTSAISEMIAQTVDELTQRLDEVRKVRLDVREMAINIDLRCRRLDEVGKPVSVIAKEIWAQSNSLDGATEEISKEVVILGDVVSDVSGGAEDRTVDVNEALADALARVRSGAMKTEQAIDAAGEDASRVVDMLERTSMELVDKLSLSKTIKVISRALQAMIPEVQESEPSEAASTMLRGLLPQIAKLYTMAKEREVHGRFLLPDMVEAAAPASAADEDDGLFDDGLF
ncbi:hypothetical protein [Aurantiacibacter suaedae]|uniref:hypothetical protein n=1 Tax=Aurantiacibacter suaedae TaxID=2545755 RepID=UPI0010F55898|nr:hypothetical protein [Aurantiacibacter suaedae]